MRVNSICLLGVLLWTIHSTFGQTVCDPADLIGTDLVTNGDFESGDVGFTTDLSYSWNASGAPGACYSNSGEYYVGTSPQDNVGGCQFQSGWGYTSYEGSNYMMVDGAESPGDVVWAQTVSGIEINTYYYFSVAVTSLSSGNLAQLKFEIDGVLQDTTLDAPATPGDWIVYNQVWYSGATSGSISIEITDQRAGCGGCPDNNDYGLDAISFQKGCPTDAFDDQPELGDDQTFCGTTGTITLDPGVTKDADNFIYWSTGTNDNDETIDVTVAGTYYVCVNETGTCTKIDSVNISDDYTINIGDDTELCDPTEITMDAGHSGIGVSYQWYLDDAVIDGATSKTLTVNSSGEYKVIVDDATCDEKADSIDVTVEATHADPNDIGFCLESNPDTTLTFSLASAGSHYNWYDSENAASPMAGGTGVATYTLSGIGPNGDTLWVEDNTLTTYPNNGPTNLATTGPGWGYNRSGYRRGFDALSNLTILNVDIKTENYQGPCNGICCGATSDTITIELANGGVRVDTVIRRVSCGTSNTISLDFVVPAGTGYTLGLGGVQSDGANGYFHTNTTETSQYDIASVITIDSKFNSGMFFNWEIEAESACEKVPIYAYNNCLLPVEFAYFNVVKTSDGGLLKWATATELNNSHFEIQRSTDGRFYETIAVVDGYGNSDNLIEYEFLDNSITSGTYYYRLMQVDYDGAFDFSKVVSLNHVEEATIEAYPNPFNDNINISVSALSDIEYHIDVFDILGVPVYSTVVNANSTIEIGEDFASGVYLVSVWAGKDKQTIKIIKK